MLAYIFGLGTTELLIIALIIAILFGASRIPALARSLGASLNEFKKGIKDSEKEKKNDKSNAAKDSTG